MASTHTSTAAFTAVAPVQPVRPSIGPSSICKWGMSPRLPIRTLDSVSSALPSAAQHPALSRTSHPLIVALGFPIPLPVPGAPHSSTSTSSSSFVPGRARVDADLSGQPVAAGAFGEVFYGTLRACGTPVVLKRARTAGGSLAGQLLRHERAVTKALPDLGSQHARWPRFLGDYEWHSKKYVMWERVGDSTLEDYISAMPKAALARAVGLSTYHHAPAMASPSGTDTTYFPVSTSLSPYPGNLDVPMFRKVVGDLLISLDTLHANGFVHRDIKPANIIVSGKAESPLQLIDFGSAVATQNVLFSRPVDTLDPLYAAPEKRLSPLAPDRFDVFSVGLIGLRVLLPSFSSERTLREFRNLLQSVDYDLMRYRKERCSLTDLSASGMSGELAGLFSSGNTVNVQIADLLTAMLRRNPANRITARRALERFGLF